MFHISVTMFHISATMKISATSPVNQNITLGVILVYYTAFDWMITKETISDWMITKVHPRGEYTTGHFFFQLVAEIPT